MRVVEIQRHLDQINKLRAKLQDQVNPVHQIIKPVGMRTAYFENRIERLAKHEHSVIEKLRYGLCCKI